MEKRNRSAGSDESHFLTADPASLDARVCHDLSPTLICASSDSLGVPTKIRNSIQEKLCLRRTGMLARVFAETELPGSGYVRQNLVDHATTPDERKQYEKMPNSSVRILEQGIGLERVSV